MTCRVRWVVVGAMAMLLALWWPVPGTRLSAVELRCFWRAPSFTLGWMHSVEKELWQEQYVREGDRLVLMRSRFKTFGAGVPSDGLPVTGESGFVTYALRRELPQLDWVVSRAVNSTLWIEGVSLPVHLWLPDYTEVLIQPVHAPLWTMLKKDFCDEQRNKQRNAG